MKFATRLSLLIVCAYVTFHCASGFACGSTRVVRSCANLSHTIHVKVYPIQESSNCSSHWNRFLLHSSVDDDSYNDVNNVAPLSDDVIMIVDCSSILEKDKAIDALRLYLHRFPFAVVLPVQPMSYLPSETGVMVTFLRKKTQEKGSIDGGMIFDVVGDDDDSTFESSERCRFQLIGKRNTDGQSVSKMFSEKLVVQTMLKRLDGDQDYLGLRVESIFHRWL